MLSDDCLHASRRLYSVQQAATVLYTDKGVHIHALTLLALLGKSTKTESVIAGYPEAPHSLNPDCSFVYSHPGAFALAPSGFISGPF